MERRIVAITLLPLLASALLLSGPLGNWSAPFSHDFVTVPLIFLVVACVEIRPIRVRGAVSRHQLVLDELHLVAGMAIASPRGYVLGATLGVAFIFIAHRDRLAVVFMNSVWFAFGATAAIGTMRAVTADHGFVSPQGALGVALGLVVSTVVNAAMLAVLDCLRGGGIADVLHGVPSWVLSALSLGMVGYGALAVFAYDSAFGLASLGILYVLWNVFIRFERLRSDRAGMLLLHETTSAVQRMPAAEHSLDALLAEAIKLSDGDEAEILLIEGGEPLYAVGSRDNRSVGSEEARVPAMLQVISELGRSGESTSWTADTMSALVGQAPSALGLVTVRRDAAESEGFQDSDRRLFEMFVNHAAIALENSQLFVQLREEMAQRQHQALHDALTTLPNRVQFDASVRKAVAGVDIGELAGVVLTDIDGFKEVNDTLGHHQGDVLLQIVADRVSELADDNIVVARLGGDEFAAVIRNASSISVVEDLASRLKDAIEEPIEVSGVPVHVNTSVGISVCDHETSLTLSPEVLLQQADVAMYSSKGSSVRIATYCYEDDPYSPERLALAAELRVAVERGEIIAHFQPELDIATNTVVAVEALARWPHPVRGNVYPDQFIPLAEASGLIRDLTYSILEQTLSQLMKWRTQGFVLTGAVNLSVRCLQDEHLVDEIMRRVDCSGVDPAQLVLEITEGTIMADPEHALAVLSELHSYGIKLSIDDFGTGYSSLTQLKHLPVDQVKIDRSFVTNMPTDPDDAAIAQIVVELGHALGLKVIAEGIEDIETLGMLRDMKCDIAQGYYIKRPAPGSEISEWLHDRALENRAVHASVLGDV